ncbi:MAG: HAD family hydrolase [Spirochaetota bacterium]
MNLALFDFDRTITTIDTYIDFIYFAAERKRIMLGKMILIPVILGYKLGIIPSGKTRETVAGFAFKGRKLTDIQSIGVKYADQVLPQYVIPEALKIIEWHKSQGDTVVIVSASFDVYLKRWCDKHGLGLICSQFEVKDGLITGKYYRGDCGGKEKAKRIKENYNIEKYQTIYAYGDSADDKEMMDLADIKYFRWKLVSNKSSSEY